MVQSVTFKRQWVDLTSGGLNGAALYGCESDAKYTAGNKLVNE